MTGFARHLSTVALVPLVGLVSVPFRHCIGET